MMVSRVLGALALVAPCLHAQASLYQSKAFTVTDTSVVQGQFSAIAISRDTILSTYPRTAREVHFKFAFRAPDDEFPPGTEHMITLRPRDGRIVTPAYAYGVEQPPHVPTPEESAGGEDGIAQVTFRVDMRDVLRSLREHGYYDPPNGARITGKTLPPLYVVGDVEPLTWDANALRPRSRLELTDPDNDGIYTVTLPFQTEYGRPLSSDGRAMWARHLDVSGFPQLTSNDRLLDAVYRLSLEELRQLVRGDGALSAGAKWPGVWTRDVSLSTVLALALVVPDAARVSLMAKVDSAGRIIQDTGTGGSWPISTDRMTWAMAAWELYAATGDRAWLRQAYDIIRRSAKADLHAARDPGTGLMRGESSFLDWREQSYPRWMQPADIGESEALGTNAVHYAAYRILANMARELGEKSSRWSATADSIGRGMNAHMWNARDGWYGQYRYGRAYLSLSPRFEALGEALTVAYGAATPARARELSRRAPVVAFGTPTFWPYIPNERLYHNGTIWPFVTGYWTWAAADARDGAAVEHGLGNLTRATALFLTNKENMVAETGHFEGTALNSDRQLWSVAASLAAEYRVLFGMRLEPARIVFRPMVPPGYDGERTLSGFRYRQSVLTIVVHGHGNGVRRAVLDGRALARPQLPASLTGAHTIDLYLNGQWPRHELQLAENRFAPATPALKISGDTLSWSRVSSVDHYVVYRNGRSDGATHDTTRVVDPPLHALDEYQVVAEDSGGIASFLSEPARAVRANASWPVKPRGPFESERQGFSGAGYMTLSLEQNRSVELTTRVDCGGTYVLDARYANGSGPINTADKVAVRTVFVDGRQAGVIVMPQRGQDRWNDWGYSTPVFVRLAPGAHRLRIEYTPLDENMNRRVNTALLDVVRLTRLEPGAPRPQSR